MFPNALAVLFQLPAFFVAPPASTACSCSSVTIPVHVDTLVPKDPTDIFGGLKSDASSLRRVDDTYDIYGVYCKPDDAPSDVLQLLVHGLTYSSQYWSTPVAEFRNHSYAAYSCDHGLPSLAIDWPGVGLSSRPVNADDVQYPTVSAAVSQLARSLKEVSILPGAQPFKKVIGVGHSAGCGMLIFDAVVEGEQSPFDGLVLTGALTVAPGTLPPVGSISARDADPQRWGDLDPGYFTAPDRSGFYPPDPASFSPRMLAFDGFTKDLGTIGTYVQASTSSLTKQYTGPVAMIVGAADQMYCAGTGRCDDVANLTAIERTTWPAVQSFEVVVSPGSGGHSLNLDFFAGGAFKTIVHFVNKFSAGP
ncbi:Alpha/Beta hydrolase protein [Mycena belliarum]|uniref:Alpha/Beta hydrolase protein n=1 Tax=Mycena belliarum TaxID=1033014 RepID=A0AAD6XW56_9AGAR|nr:Alpha/Beta hydrolase protein [Mycena belliae]